MPEAESGGIFERKTIDIAGVKLEIHEAGAGPTLLYLHAGGGFRPSHPAMPLLAKNYRVIAPSHPGFGRSSLPNWMNSVDDYAHVYLELLQRLNLSDVLLIGASIGGWTAAELATKSTARLSRLVLIGAPGIKVGPRDKLDIPDVFAMAPAEFENRLFHNPEKYHPDFSNMSDEELSIVARNRQTLALIAWEPYLHNPKLKHRLQMIDIPTMMIRGTHDGLISNEYAQAYANLIPGCVYAEIPEAGHAPDIEQATGIVETLTQWMEN
ncbi:MAG: hydrolase [Rhodospirillaceae bacterium]|nr:hydrolase [Rhodospirillaceae bacterium]